MSRYDDIINMEHHVSPEHPKMSMHDRAAQFSPFAALTGHSDAIRETARLTQEKVILDISVVDELNGKLLLLKSHIHEMPVINITYFVEDERKAGGHYQTTKAALKKIDENSKILILEDGTVIPMHSIRSIEPE